MIGVRREDPSTSYLNEAFSAAASGIQDSAKPSTSKASAWPVLTFLGLIFATPYLIMKLIGQVSTTAIEECKHTLFLLFTHHV